jgi:ribosomal protein S18 acetylase RimI-like enzyme
MNVRPATEEDAAVVADLWREFNAEVPEPPGFTEDDDEPSEFVYLAEDGGEIVGLLEATAAAPQRWHVDVVHVRPAGRRRGVATALLRACTADARSHGAQWVSLDVLASNAVARDVWRRLGFEEVELLLAQPLDALELRLGDAPAGPSHASTHVQTDDRTSVERALAQFVPRLAAPDVRDAANGWIRIADPQLDADRAAQSRFASDLSDRLGAVVVALAVEQGTVVRFRLYERGRMVDEYLSVPSYDHVTSKGDELALAANPTLVARLTGADHDEVRRVARTAASPAELPPADELYAQIARLMGLEP